jgi:hypothetical protein
MLNAAHLFHRSVITFNTVMLLHHGSMTLKISALYSFSSGICSHSWTAVSMLLHNCGISDVQNVASAAQMRDNLMGQGQVCVVDGSVGPSEMTDCYISCVGWIVMLNYDTAGSVPANFLMQSLQHVALNVVPWGYSSTWMTPSAYRNFPSTNGTCQVFRLSCHISWFLL